MFDIGSRVQADSGETGEVIAWYKKMDATLFVVKLDGGPVTAMVGGMEVVVDREPKRTFALEKLTALPGA